MWHQKATEREEGRRRAGGDLEYVLRSVAALAA
jgi:hypothetical protein